VRAGPDLPGSPRVPPRRRAGPGGFILIIARVGNQYDDVVFFYDIRVKTSSEASSSPPSTRACDTTSATPCEASGYPSWRGGKAARGTR
jgi:hypothetical protein